jgi:glycine/D-amino acid oxidase-like deaminating enzyme/nitrite reductase/ring-hydroxylating ferredoxin subunit
MASNDMSEQSRPATLWAQTAAHAPFGALSGDIDVDVAIIGGGITGVTAAMLLKRAGKRVALLEAGGVGGGVTGHTTAHITQLYDERYHKLIDSFGARGARTAMLAARAAIDFIGQLAAEAHIDCAFERVPAFLYSEDERGARAIGEEFEATRRIGMEVELVDRAPLPFAHKKALRIENQAQFHPLRYLNALAQAIPGDGSHLFEQTRAGEFKDGEPCIVKTAGGSVRAGAIVLATHTVIGDRVVFQPKIAPYRSYVLAFRLLGDAPPPGLYWDTADPYHYTRRFTHPERGELLIVGGEDHKTGQEPNTPARYEALERYARERYRLGEIAFRWSSQVYEPADGLPYIGRHPFDAHTYVATGYAGVGMTMGTVAALIICDQVLGRENAWAKLYDAGRVNLQASTGTLVAEGLNLAGSAVASYFRNEGALADIPVGAGRVVQSGLEKLAVYRDEGGALHAMSAVCTHMKCIVGWNEAERSWDCPCHGGRYTPDGRVIEGPPLSGLQPAKLPDGAE